MTYTHEGTPQGIEAAIAHAKAGSACNPTFVWTEGPEGPVKAAGNLPQEILKRGGFIIYVDDVGRWVPRGNLSDN